MKYLAIGFWYEGQDFSLSIETDSDDPIQVSDELTKAAKFKDKDWLAVVLLVENGIASAPKVREFWRGENGDFD